MRLFTTPRTSRAHIAAQHLHLVPLVDHYRLLFFKTYDGEGHVVGVVWSPQDVADGVDVADFACD